MFVFFLTVSSFWGRLNLLWIITPWRIMEFLWSQCFGKVWRSTCSLYPAGCDRELCVPTLRAFCAAVLFDTSCHDACGDVRDDTTCSGGSVRRTYGLPREKLESAKLSTEPYISGHPLCNSVQLLLSHPVLSLQLKIQQWERHGCRLPVEVCMPETACWKACFDNGADRRPLPDSLRNWAPLAACVLWVKAWLSRVSLP